MSGNLATEDSIGIIQAAPNTVFMFMGDNMKEVGRLQWRQGKFTFIGNADETAELFFKEVIARAHDNNVGILRHDLYRLATAVNGLYKIKESSPEALAVYRAVKTLVDTYAPPPG